MAEIFGGVFEELKAWQMAVVVVLVAGIGGGVYAGYAAVTDSGETAAEAGDTSIPVQRGDLVLQVTTDGAVTFPRTESVTFDISGTVGEVLVSEGDSVSVGDTIARLSERDRAELESALAAARVAVAEARDALAAELDPVDPLVVAQGQVALSDARQGVEAAIDALAELQETSPAELAAARLAVAEATVKLGDAREALSGLVEPDEDALAAAITGLVLAEETLANQVAQTAAAEVDRAEAAGDAADAVAEAVAEYRGVFELWLGVDPSTPFGTTGASGVNLTETDPDAVLTALGTDLAILFDPSLSTVELGFEEADAGLPVDDPATAWDELVVFTWLSLFPGTVALTVGDGVAEAGTRYVADELDAAWETVREATGLLSDLGLADALAGTGEASGLEQKRMALDAAATALDDLLAGADAVDVDVAVQRVAFAEAEAEETRVALAALEAGPDALEVEKATSALVVAREVLAAAQDALDEAQAGPDGDRVALREAQLAAAVLAVGGAEKNLADATLTSLYDGVVTDLLIEVGDLVNRGTQAAVVVDQSVVEVVGSVDEIDVLKVAEGAAATVALDALGGRVLPGVVTFLAATPGQGQVVSYEFRVTVEVPQGVALLEGLTATATVVTSRQTDVLLVPNNAVGGSVIQPTVRVDTGDGVEERPVTLGQSDGFWTAVLAGLVEGEQVMIVSSSSSAQTEGFGALRGLGGGVNFGGGRGGEVRVFSTQSAPAGDDRD